ncbi:hypothetical protein [Cohnella sp. REN36]|uniref:hypothetical protein n=1 Tax=Cohnella sp. REN36 TaxID=2887347 RepID=UPI001D137E25|nr:hypothetical protein [Cohnella sp. REN36]MCC3373914.1 hypothetical protein [Cohnella sp. REN36]
MRYTYTWALALIGLALVLFNATGYDPHNLFLFMFSVPIWFVELFGDIHQVSVAWMYVLTVASWALIGYIIDRILIGSRARRSA